ncbi:MAG: Gfo/Idh/MocA family oxidoreductase [Anaerolineae bacterium]|nr:Gfo/Idh/MocA family oxidoreductase [Anaerolineae bacterium]
MTISIGIIGSGQITQRSHLPGLQADKRCKVVAIAARNEDRLQQVATNFNIPHYYTDWRKMLDEEPLDAVTITTPPVFHREMVVAALEKGLDVLVEKPLAPSLKDVEVIVGAAKQSDRIVMVEQTLRYNPTFWQVAELIRSGVIGEIKRIHAALLNLGARAWAPDSTWFFDPEIAGGGALLDSGVHMVDLVRHMSGSNLADLNGELVYTNLSPVEEEATLTAWLENDVQATIDLSWHVDPPRVAITLYGSEGYLHADAKSPIPVMIHHKNGQVSIPTVDRPTWFGYAYKHFVDCCQQRTQPLTSVLDNQHTIAPLLSLYQKPTTQTRHKTFES